MSSRGASGSSSIRAADLRSTGTGGTAVDGLTRFGLPFAASSEDRAGMQALIAQRKREELLILTNLEPAVLSAFELEDRTYVVGHSQEAGLWLAVGVQRDDLAELLPARRSRPYAGLIPTRPRTEAVETA
ncbi:hypothetical protein [Microbacterium elymi]|uniref:Uncharacterized protein n=1 Tax=Microbacterium elymi TaxID=2909587 RepID=A0ABY5NH45_9MICO|nr:hypothetical protein [Microbacterium elymi]UUT34485.1 hypothetical protein L2X98_28435 [Microbacterium elymi]